MRTVERGLSISVLSPIIYDKIKTNIILLITGPPGSFKTVLMANIVADIIKYSDLYAIYLDASGMGRRFEDYLAFMKVPVRSPLIGGRFITMDLAKMFKESPERDISEVLYSVRETSSEVLENKLAILVVDPLDSPFVRLRPDYGLPVLVNSLIDLKSELKVVGIVVNTNTRSKELIETLSVISDAWLVTGFISLKEKRIPAVKVKKFRGVRHSYDTHPIILAEKGLRIGNPL
ncbi:MAG TPA: hypothetical protein ENF25_03230 [Thermoprotei archaeon]|nr:hypothetical protein [Euryarchaeota archaeon]HDJ51195.1 hypothetical protein [Thermoprotei archaeon]